MIGLLNAFGFDDRPRGSRRHDHPGLGCSYRKLGRKRRNPAHAYFESLHREGREIRCLEAQRVHARSEMAEDKPATIGRHRFLDHATALVKRRDGHGLDHGLALIVDETPDASRVRLRVHGQAGHQHKRCDADAAKQDGRGTDELGTHFRACDVRSAMWGSMQHSGELYTPVLSR